MISAVSFTRLHRVEMYKWMGMSACGHLETLSFRGIEIVSVLITSVAPSPVEKLALK